MFAKLCYWD